MGKMLGAFLKLFLIVIAGFLVLCVTMQDNTSEIGQAVSKYSPLAKNELKYVKIDNANAHDSAGYGNFDYDLKSYDTSGKEHPIKFTGMGKLKQGHYLELDTKGTYVKTYREVFSKDLPNGVEAKLNLK